MVVCNSQGDIMAVLSEQIPMPSSVLMLETLAARRAVLFIHELGFNSSSFEGDSEVLSINALRHKNLMHSSIGHFVKDTLSYANSLQSFSFSHIFRQGNSLTYVLAKRVRFSFPIFAWKESVPVDIHDFLVAD